MADDYSGKVIAAPASQLYAGSAKCIGHNKWLIQQGRPVHEYVTATGSDLFVQYNWHATSTNVYMEDFVVLHPYLQAHLKRQLIMHDLADTMSLTDKGLQFAGKPSYSSHTVYRKVLTCTGKGHNVPKAEVDACSCQRKCGGLGVCKEGCKESKKRNHYCKANITITRNFSQVVDGTVLVTMNYNHVPAGERRIPPELSHLRIDAHVAQGIQQSVILQGSCVHTAVNSLKPGLDITASKYPGSTVHNTRFFFPHRFAHLLSLEADISNEMAGT